MPYTMHACYQSITGAKVLTFLNTVNDPSLLDFNKRTMNFFGCFFRMSTCPCLINPKAPIITDKFLQLYPTFYVFHLAVHNIYLVNFSASFKAILASQRQATSTKKVCLHHLSVKMMSSLLAATGISVITTKTPVAILTTLLCLLIYSVLASTSQLLSKWSNISSQK